METMVSDSHFHTQLTSIMEMLAKTAVVEIGKLVEQSQAMLKLEISRRITENQSLKNKCDFLEKELKATRRSVQASAGVQFGSGSNDVGHRPTIDGVFGKEWCMDLWKEKGSTTSQKNEARADPCMLESVDLMDDEPDMIIIKDETFEDCSGKSKLQADSRSSDKGTAFSSIEGDVAQSGEDFITYTIPLDHTRQRQASDQTFAPRTSTVADGPTSSDVNSEEFGGFYPGNASQNAPKTVAAGAEQKKFQCMFCEKNFSYLSYLKVHLRIHSGEKPFACPVCGKRFAQKTYLKIHMRTHSGERPYTCIECGRSFSQKSSLNIHLRRHTGEKPYTCVDCGKRYANKHGINRHQCTS